MIVDWRLMIGDSQKAPGLMIGDWLVKH